MDRINALREKLSEDTKDLKLNIQSVLTPEKLSHEQTWGVALAASMFLGDAALTDALLADATDAGVPDGVIADARAAAALMAMNTVYYRFRHMVNDEQYTTIPAKLRMTRMSKPTSDKATFELMSVACAVLEGCEMCVNSHIKSLEALDVAPDAIHEAVRIAAAVRGFNQAHWLAERG